MSKKIIYWLVGVVVVLVIVIVGFKTDWYGLKNKTTGTNSTSTSDYSAVFLSNGQVYFGRLSNITSEWVTLTDIYYLQVAQQKDLQPKSETTSTEQPKLSLVKLGNELHGPKDRMDINQKHVLFWEELKSDGKVVQSIEKYLQDQTKK